MTNATPSGTTRTGKPSQGQTGQTKDAGPARFPWPPVLYLAAIALAGFAGALYPVPWPSSPFGDILFAIGGIGILGAILLYVGTFRALRKASTTISPMQPATALVTTGPFALSRNPIYLANTMILISLAFILGNIWFIVFGLLAAVAVTYLAILAEEKHLTLRFAKRYNDYKRRVRRWI